MQRCKTNFLSLTSYIQIDQKVEGKTALQIACYEGYTEIVKLLLVNKANPNLKDSEDDSPLHYCAFGWVFDILRF